MTTNRKRDQGARHVGYAGTATASAVPRPQVCLFLQRHRHAIVPLPAERRRCQGRQEQWSAPHWHDLNTDPITHLLWTIEPSCLELVMLVPSKSRPSPNRLAGAPAAPRPRGADRGAAVRCAGAFASGASWNLTYVSLWTSNPTKLWCMIDACREKERQANWAINCGKPTLRLARRQLSTFRSQRVARDTIVRSQRARTDTPQTNLDRDSQLRRRNPWHDNLDAVVRGCAQRAILQQSCARKT